MKLLGTLIFTLALLTGCATINPVSFVGDTHTNENLRSDSYQMLKMYMAADGCDTIDSVQSRVTQPPEGPEGQRFSKELWDVSGCGERYSFEMAFTEDGAGGAFFSVKKL